MKTYSNFQLTEVIPYEVTTKIKRAYRATIDVTICKWWSCVKETHTYEIAFLPTGGDNCWFYLCNGEKISGMRKAIRIWRVFNGNMSKLPFGVYHPPITKKNTTIGDGGG